MLQNIKLVIFDLDGVIADTEPLHFYAKSTILKSMGLDNKIDINAFIGKPNKDFWELALHGSGIEVSLDDLEKKQYDIILEQMRERKMQPSQGLAAVFDYLKAHQIKIGLCSSSNRYYIDRLLSFFQISHFFQVTVGGDEVKVKKPAPDGYLKVLELAGIPAQYAVAVEDSTSGIQAAKNADLTCIGYQNPTSENQNLEKADQKIYSISELIGLFDDNK